MATTPTQQITVDDPAVDEHDGHAPGGDGHGHHAPMLQGHDGKMYPSKLQHHFVSAEQQFEASKLGMWLFLATEILLFGGMFVAYAVFRFLYPEVYDQASTQLDTILGAMNTLVLLLSSFTVAWAIRAAQTDQHKKLFNLLVITAVLAGGFLVVKGFEYKHKFDYGIYPGAYFVLADGRTVGEESGIEGFASGAAEGVAPENERAGEPEAAGGAVAEGDDAGEPGADQGLGTIEGTNELAADPQTADSAPALTSPEIEDDGDPRDQEIPEPQIEENLTEAEELLGEGSAGLLAGADEEGGHDVLEHGDSHKAGGHGITNRRAGLFFAIYYVMTGIHGLHVLIGMIAFIVLAVQARRGHFSSVYYTPVENVGLYWHVVDVIWIFVFPLMYLI